jgi:hypothetical protein
LVTVTVETVPTIATTSLVSSGVKETVHKLAQLTHVTDTLLQSIETLAHHQSG